jgi:hypothetical protein
MPPDIANDAHVRVRPALSHFLRQNDHNPNASSSLAAGKTRLAHRREAKTLFALSTNSMLG